MRAGVPPSTPPRIVGGAGNDDRPGFGMDFAHRRADEAGVGERHAYRHAGCAHCNPHAYADCNSNADALRSVG